MMTKKAAQQTARAGAEKTFQWPCETHGEHPHYASNGKCIGCQKELASERWERTSNDPAALARHNERQRAAMAKLREEPEQRAKDINSRAIQRLRELGRPETAMPTPETLQQCLDTIKAAPKGAEMDHAVPLEGIDPITGKPVVCGLHVACNLEPMTKRSNARKSDWFDPENPLEFQKPRNAFPGGQFHGPIGEIERMRYMTPTTLELMTVKEFYQAVIDGGNEAMEEWAATADHIR